MLAVLAEFRSPPSRRLVQSVPLDRLLEMDETAAKSPRPPLYKLASFWRADLGENFGAAPQFIARVRELPEVADAYLDGGVAPAALNPDPAGNPLFGANGQGHLRPAPQGIDAPFAWLHPGGDGAGVDLVDLEAG